MALATRKPTGLTPWPMLLIAGVEKAGKSWSCAEASGSPLVHRTFWVGVGEDDPDEYANVPGADFEIAPHDGTYRGILNVLEEAVNEPSPEGKANMIVLDSASRLWDLIKNDMEEILLGRLRRKKQPIPDDLKLSMDLWNLAAQRWDHIMDTLRAHRGPVLITARLNYVTLMDDKGQPTKAKDWKVEAQKSLPYDVSGIIQLRARGDAWIMGLKSTRFTLDEPDIYPKFSVQDLWSKLGVGETPMADRTHATVRAVDSEAPTPVVASTGRPDDWWFVTLSEVQTTEGLREFYRGTAANPTGQGVPADWKELLTARAEEFKAAA